MRSLVRAEMIKVVSTRATIWLLLGTLAMVALTVGVSIPKAGAENPPVPLDAPGVLADAVGTGLLIPQVLVMLLGVLAVTQEFRYGTATSTYLVEPRRTRVLVAKWVTLAITGVVITLGTLALSVPFAIALISSRDGDVTAGAQFWQMAAAGSVMMAAYGVIGVAIGTVVRHQIGAVVGVLVWMLAVEYVVIPAFPSPGRWLPGGASWAMLQLGPSSGVDGLLSADTGGLVLAGYTVIAATVAILVAPRRDIL